MSKEASSIVPNVRFGTAFLDVLKRDRAVNGETLMDKQAGDIIHRRGDGRMLWYSQEKILPFEFLGQIRARSKTYKNFKMPKSTSSVYGDTYFVSSLLDVKTWEFEEREDGVTPSLLLGDKLPNTYPDLFSVSYETNGFFIQLNVAPKDLGLIQLLNAKYNAKYENYDELADPDGLAKKAMYEKYNYKDGQLTVNFTVDWYDTNEELVHTETTDAYVCVNEVTFVPFATTALFSRDIVAYAKMKINYIEAPKLKEGLDLFTTEAELALVRAVKDTFDISFMTMNVSFFLTIVDQNLYLANWINHTELILVMGIPEYLSMIDRAPLSGKEYGVRVSIPEPSLDIWKTTSLWVELMRKISPHGGDSIHGDDVEYTGSPTSITEIEDGINGINYNYVDLSLHQEDKAFYVENTGQIIINMKDDEESEGGD